MQESRTQKTTRNLVTGFLNRGVEIGFPFLIRTAILRALGAEYTGLIGLFSSILEVLNIANLGFDTSIVYCLYEPMAKNDKEKIRYYITIYKKVYNIVGTIVLLCGMVLLPFLPRLIKGSYPETINIYFLYILYLLNSAISYFLFAYKSSLLIADQRKDVSNNIRTAVGVIRYTLQFLVILFTKNFYVYVIVQIGGTVLSNLLIQVETTKRYPDLICNSHQKLKLPDDLKKQTGALLIGRICDTCRNSFDSIIISMLFGLIMTTIYGNYYYIYSAVYGLMLVVATAVSASIGNSIACKTPKENFVIFRKVQFLYSALSGLCTVCLVGMYQPFMTIWAGNNLMLSDNDMFLFCLYFYLINMCNIRNQYINGTGMWDKLKLNYIMEAVSNLILNFVLGKFFGITGIVLATIITIFFYNYFLRTHKLFKTYFISENEIIYHRDQLKYFSIVVLAGAVVVFIGKKVVITEVFKLLLMGFVSVTVYLAVFILAFHRSILFKQGREIILKMLGR